MDCNLALLSPEVVVNMAIRPHPRSSHTRPASVRSFGRQTGFGSPFHHLSRQSCLNSALPFSSSAII